MRYGTHRRDNPRWFTVADSGWRAAIRLTLVESPAGLGDAVRPLPPRQHGRVNAVRDRSWPANTIDHAPLWGSVDLRDGNQSLVNPMDLQRKTAMFDLLLRIGFKDIEVGYPSSSQADFDFVRSLIIDDRIPDDVTISVFTPARPELIDRTFQSIQGADRAVVHLCHATACLWREVVFGLSAEDVRQLAVDSAEQLMWQSDYAHRRALRVLTRDLQRHRTRLRPVGVQWCGRDLGGVTGPSNCLLNLPSTVETDSPQRLRRPDRMDAPQSRAPGLHNPVGRPAQRSRHRCCVGRTRHARRRRPRRGHAVRKR